MFYPMWRIVRYWQVPLADRWLILKIAFLLYGVWLGLRLFRFQRLYYILERFRQPQGSPINHKKEVLEKISFWVEKVGANLLGKDSCFPQALVGQLLLSRLGLEPNLQFGVLKEKDGCLRAHAWVEIDGKVVIGGPISQVEKYITLSEFSSNNL